MKNRIEYIDAMRGLTMILVVYSHIRFYGYHLDDYSTSWSFNSLFILIRMPLFFFISGFLFYKSAWSFKSTLTFIKKKAQIQILPTLLFMGIYALLFDYHFINGIFSTNKLGYWFTIALFNFYLSYLLIGHAVNRFKMKGYMEETAWVIIGLGLHFMTTTWFLQKAGIQGPATELLSLNMFKYFLFFIIGTLVRKHFDTFSEEMQKKYFPTLAILLFCAIAIPYMKYDALRSNSYIEHLVFIVAGILGIFIVFLCFHKYQYTFSSQTYAGRVLQFIGKRTLDIYLLHYLFIPRDLENLGNQIHQAGNPCIELAVSTLLAFLVIGLCLVASSIIRTSPILGHYLFGAKTTN